MSFNINWKQIDDEKLSYLCKDILTTALNSGKSPSILASNIIIKDLCFGKIAPDFEILEIGELDKDRFRGIFKINYEGDFHLTLHTKVHANPLHIYENNSIDSFITPNFVLASQEFAIPLDLKLSDIKISGIGIIVFSKSKGLTLVFRNDPLDSIKVSSTFDTVQVLANFLQKQIEDQIRDLFRETLPTLIHQLSLKYLNLDNNINELTSRLGNIPNTSSTSALKLDDEDLIYSAKNLQQSLQLFKSRETMSLNIPKFKNIIQRTNLDKINKISHYPNLLNSLSSNHSDLQKYQNHHNNGIPIEILIDNFNKTDHILKDISSIQATNFYKHTNKDAPVPKRRTIKMKKKSKPSSMESTFVTTTPVSEVTQPATPATPSTTSTKSSKIQQPTPQRVKPQNLYEEFIKSTQTPPGYDNKVIGVGLGNSNILNFVPNRGISTSPIKTVKSQEKSINYIDINKINKKLNQIKEEKKFQPGINHQDSFGYGGIFEFTAPPPYKY
ncbi:unnamed protein product [Candida verbasci]|uniref:Mitochondrial distribution and morphology protein 34 n=1 Tax=Candida verbasci TaxID=1227364 RepID=A0A9W4X9I8_9ASCO|nr:unnamed protein product [Candida verbasci]